MNTRERWSKFLLVAGYVAVLAGALDPLEGALLILPGSAMLALASRLAQGDRAWLPYRAWSLVLIACGVAALFGLSAAGGIGGKSGNSAWWGLLLLPYPAGWLMALWGPGSPRWVSLAGIAVGGWYVVLPLLVLAGRNPSRPVFPLFLLGLGFLGLVIIGGCLWRLRRR
jgi:hypothetical protein